MKNCVEMVRPFVEELAEQGIDNVQLIGGIGSCALQHPDTEILPDEKLIVAPAGLYLPRLREKGSLRDLDCLVKSTDEAAVEDVKATAINKIGRKELKYNFFGYKTFDQLFGQSRRLLRGYILNNTSDRYVLEEDGEVIAAMKAVVPFAVDMDLETLETWQVQVGRDEQTFPVPHPGTQVLNYLTRSISGLRPKDRDKVDAMTRNIAAKAPEIIDWIADGPGASQLLMARDLHSLREPRSTHEQLDLGGALLIDSRGPTRLHRDPAFMFRGRPRLLRALVEAEHFKTRVMSPFENNEAIVNFWQEQIEPRTAWLTRNK